MSERQGIPMNFLTQGEHTDAYARLMGGANARILGTVYGSGVKGDGYEAARSRFDLNTRDWFAAHCDGVAFDYAFPAAWRSAREAHSQIATDTFGTNARYYDPINRLKYPPVDPHDLLKALKRGDAEKRYTHEARVLATFTAISMAAEHRVNDMDLRKAFLRIDGTIDKEMCEGGYATISSGTLSSLHDPTTFQTLATQFGTSGIENIDGAISRNTSLSLRTMRLGERRIPFYTGSHEKTLGSVIAKTIDNGLGYEPARIDPLRAVGDFHGLLMVPMREDDYEALKLAYLAHVGTIYRDIKLVDDHNASHGLGSNPMFQRWKVQVDPHNLSKYIELMFMTPKQYLDGEVHIGNGVNGLAHSLHRVRRMTRERAMADGSRLSPVDIVFPESIYGVDPREMVQKNMAAIAQEIKNSMLTQ